MTNSAEPCQKAGQILERIFFLLEETKVRREIEDPIDEILTSVEITSQPSVSLDEFHQAIADFIRKTYRYGLRLSRELSLSQARSEAICLLEQLYQGSHSKGYEAALLDLTNPELDGLNVVLAVLAEGIKVRERERYIRWVFASQLDPSDWQTKCEIAELMIDRLRPFLHEELALCGPAQRADQLPEIIASELESGGFLQQLCSSYFCLHKA